MARMQLGEKSESRKIYEKYVDMMASGYEKVQAYEELALIFGRARMNVQKIIYTQSFSAKTIVEKENNERLGISNKVRYGIYKVTNVDTSATTIQTELNTKMFEELQIGQNVQIKSKWHNWRAGKVESKKGNFVSIDIGKSYLESVMLCDLHLLEVGK